METPVAQTEDATSFEREVVPGEPKAVAERRSHTWKVRERMALASCAAVVITTIAPLWLNVQPGSAGVISNGQWTLAIVVVFFIGGKSTVEALVSIRGIK